MHKHTPISVIMTGHVQSQCVTAQKTRQRVGQHANAVSIVIVSSLSIHARITALPVVLIIGFQGNALQNGVSVVNAVTYTTAKSRQSSLLRIPPLKAQSEDSSLKNF